MATPRPRGKVNGHPHQIDTHVGERIRHRRVAMGVSQMDLAGACGITFQQVQKYESGANRVSASRLMEIAKTLGVRPGWFFDGAPGMEDIEKNDASHDPLADLEVLALATTFSRIKDPKMRQHIAGIVEAVRHAS